MKQRLLTVVFASAAVWAFGAPQWVLNGVATQKAPTTRSGVVP